jgi:hypothetical protein
MAGRDRVDLQVWELEHREFRSGRLVGLRRYDGLADNRSPKDRCEHCGRVWPGARVWLFHRGHLIGVSVAEVSLLRAQAKYVEIWSRVDGYVGLTESSLGALMAAHPAEWVQCHRNAAVRPECVRRLSVAGVNHSCEVEGVEGVVAVSRRTWVAFRDAVIAGHR